MNFNNIGIGLIEMSHRSKEFIAVTDTAEKLLRELLEIPDNYKVRITSYNVCYTKLLRQP